MKKIVVKNYLLTLAQLPILLAQLLLACLDLLLTKCLVILSNPVSMPFAEKIKTSDCPHNPPSLDIVWYWLSKQDDAYIEHCRRELEKTDVGHIIVSKNPNRHLYAVLKPTRAESLQRIKNVLYALRPEVLAKLIQEIEIILSA